MGSDDDSAPIDNWRSARKKPVEVEFRGPYTDTAEIETLEGDFEVDEAYIEEHDGYVIIRGVHGEVYPCGLDIFRETYEQVRRDERARRDELMRLYDLMEALSDEHDADLAHLDKLSEGRAAIVLEFDMPMGEES